MSQQYANKKVAEIQKGLYLWEVKKIDAITSNKSRKIELEVECSEKGKTLKGIKVNGEEAVCRDFFKDIEIPKICDFKVENITSENITNIKLSFDFTNYIGFNKVHLWELYEHKRKKIILWSFLSVFIGTLLTSLIISLFILMFSPVKINNKHYSNLSHEMIEDTIIIKNELISNVIKKKGTIENSRNNQIILSDTSIIKSNSHFRKADSNTYISEQVVKNYINSSHNREIIALIGVVLFLIINTLISLALVRILLDRLITDVFGEYSSEYLDPDIDSH